MRTVPAAMEATWRGGQYIGDQRPIARATIQHPQMRLFNYALNTTYTLEADSPYSKIDATNDIEAAKILGLSSFSSYPDGVDPYLSHKVNQTYADFLFHSLAYPKELPNIKSVQWSRSTDADAASATITLYNAEPLPIATAPLDDDLDQPGYYTFNRGGSSFSSRWNHTKNEWFGMLMPDNIIRTYEGYGCNPALAPENDPNLVLTGVWMIDTVTPSTDGLLTVTCRDLTRILMDQIAFTPVVPADFYPLSFQSWDQTVTTDDVGLAGSSGTTSGELRVALTASSNQYWSPPGTSLQATIAGHKAPDAFDGNPASYWLSIGNVSPSKAFAYEWLEVATGGQTVSQVRFKTVKTGYNAYVSVKVDGTWQGAQTIAYSRAGIGQNDANIPFVASTVVTTEDWTAITFPAVAGATAVRLTLGNLQAFPNIGTYHYRAGVREMAVFGGGSSSNTYHTVLEEENVKLKAGPAGSNPSRCSDFTDIIKLLCAWGGFYWPADGYLLHSDRRRVQVAPAAGDTAVLGEGVTGRIWGDFQDTGTYPINALDQTVWDQKALMDCVSYLRDMLGFLFYVDETGGVQWRLANYYDIGNWISDGSPNAGRTSKIYSIDERQVLVSLEAAVSSANVREGVFVADTLGQFAALVGGYNPNPTGLRRIGGYTDQGFSSVAEAQRMADMIVIQQLFTYRTDTVVIPGFPALQVDDQVRIFERVTSEGYYHYIKGISSNLDMSDGTYQYTLSTSWMGDDPNGAWIFDKDDLSASTQAYIDANIRSGDDVERRRTAL